MTEVEVLQQISTQLETLQQISSQLSDLSTKLDTYYMGIVLYLGVIAGALIGLIFWSVLKE